MCRTEKLDSVRKKNFENVEKRKTGGCEKWKRRKMLEKIKMEN